MNNKYSSVYVELTRECNLRCKHCYNSSGQNAAKLGMGKMRNIIEQMRNDNVKTIALSGGEPLLYDGIFELFNLCEQYGINTTLITNGTLINDDIASKISKLERIKIQISLDGVESTHDINRGEGNYKKTIQGINNLKRAGALNKVYIKCVINKINQYDVEDIVEEMGRIGIKKFEFGIYNELGRILVNNSMMYEDIYKKSKAVDCVNEKIHEIKKKHQEYYINTIEPTYKCPLLSKTVNCGIKIEPNGDVFPCQVICGKKYRIGNVYNKSIADIVNSEEMSKLVEFMCLAIKYNSTCAICSLEKICGKGCPAIRLNNGLDQLDENCIMTRKYVFHKILKTKENNNQTVQ